MNPKPVNRRVRKASIPPDVLEAAPREEAKSAPEEPKKPSRAAAIFRSVMGLAVVVGVACGAAWGARKYVTTSPRFAVQQIVVSGVAHHTPEEIAMAAGINVGDNVFLLDLDRAQRKLDNDPWIARSNFTRRLPGTVTIDVEERQAAIAVAAGDVWLATPGGEVFKKLEPGDPNDLIVLTGLDTDSITSDPNGTAKTIRRALDLAGDYQMSPLAPRARLEEIHVSSEGVSIVIGKNGLELVLGQAPYRHKLERAARVLGELEHRGAKAEALLLDNEARPERVVARLR